MAQHKVFVSYNNKDREIVVRAVDRLHQEGILTWFDQDDISPGEPWQILLEKALRKSLTIAVFVGPHDTGSWQREEIGLAQQLNKHDSEIKIIPVLLPGAPPRIELPHFLSNLQCVDFTGPDVLDNQTEFDRLLAAIRRESANDADEDSRNEEKLRADVLYYYQSEEANCERLVFTPSENKTRLKGSDVYVQLHLLSRVEQSRRSVPRDRAAISSGGVNKKQTTLNKVSSRVRGWLGKAPPATLPQKANQTVLRHSGERESWETVFRNRGLRLVFTGGAGSGKSFSLAQEIRKRLSQARNDLDTCRSLQDLELPILVKASALVASPYDRVADALLGSVSESSYTNSSHFVNWWRRAFNTDRGRQLFIVIDGLDELSGESAERFRKLMKQLDKLQDASVIITCRTTYFGSRRDWLAWTNNEATVVEIAPLNSEQQIELIAKWFGDDHRSRALASFLKTNYFARVFCGAPIILTLVCRVYSSTNELPGADTSYASLYKAVAKELLAGRWRDDRPDWTFARSVVNQRSAQKTRLDLISRIAWKLFESSPPNNRFTEADWKRCAAQVSTGSGAAELDPHELLVELEFVGIIIDEGSSAGEDYYSFAHRTLLEYFAAEGLLEHEPEWTRIIVKHMWCESGWEEVVRFAASITHEPNKLLNAIAKETGPATTPSRPLQWLSQFCDKTAVIAFVALLLIALLTWVLITNLSDPEWAKLKEHNSRLVESIDRTSSNEFRERPFQVIEQRTNDVLKFYAVTIETFHRQVELSSNERKQYFFPLLISAQFLLPIALVTLFVSISGGILSWIARSILYPRSFLKQDDIFRTGLRLQAEVIGLDTANAIPPEDLRYVIRQLLDSEKKKSLNIHGATSKGFVPENLLLLLGGNVNARRILRDEFWLPRVQQRTRDLKRMNNRYQRALSWYRRFLRITTNQNGDGTLRATDIPDRQKFLNTLESFGRYRSKHFHDRLATLTGLNQKPSRSSTPGVAQSEEELLRDLNKLVHGPSLFEPLEFASVTLRAETIELLTRGPTRIELSRLNRLLLEDTFGKTIRRIQKRRIRFASWCWLLLVKKFLFSRMVVLRYLKSGSELQAALRGLSLLPTNDSLKDIVGLLDESARTSCYLVNAAETAKSFTRLDVYAAKVLALSGSPTDKLAELCYRWNEENDDAPLAVKHLISVDKTRGIQAGITFLVRDSKDHGYYRSAWKTEVLDALRSVDFDEIVDELVKLDLPNELLWKELFIPWYVGYPGEAAVDFLQKIASSDILPEYFREFARHNLGSSSNTSWFHSAEWLEERADLIRRRLISDELDAAVSCFDNSIDEYKINYASPHLSAALDKIAAACDERLLKRWLERRGLTLALYSHGAVLAQLGRGANGKHVRKVLMDRIEEIDFDRGLDDADKLETVVLALRFLGELGTPEARQKLLAILERKYDRGQRIRDFLTGPSNVFWSTIIAALAKVGGEEAFQAIPKEARNARHWVACFIAARLLAERDDPEALRLLLMGHRMRGSDQWKPEYGGEPQLLDFAIACGAQIRRVHQEGSWYIVTSQSQNFSFRIPAG